MRLFAIVSFVLLVCTNAIGQSQSQSGSSSEISCAVDARWLNTTGSLSHQRSSPLPDELTLLVHMGKGSNCPSAEVTITATYLTETQDYICSGTIRNALTVSSQVQTFNLSIRPFSQGDFVRWRNAPGARGEQQGKRLPCMNLDGTVDLGDTDRVKAGWMRLSIGVIPNGGSLAVTEAMVRFAS
jgi:hypothetical protein